VKRGGSIRGSHWGKNVKKEQENKKKKYKRKRMSGKMKGKNEK
jgi:hypothetical protein